jgi:hypothetical protein
MPVNPRRTSRIFNHAVTGFDASDLTQTGTATGVTSTVTAVDALRYTVIGLTCGVVLALLILGARRRRR